MHRYLGIGVGLVMALWCVSGFVMLYVGYPRLNNADRLNALAPIQWQNCCAHEKIADALGVEVFDNFSVESVGDRPVLRVAQSRGIRRTFDLATGEALDSFSEVDALAVAKRYEEPRRDAIPLWNWLAGKLYLLAYQGSTPVRFDATTLAATPLDRKKFDRIAAKISDAEKTAIDFLVEGDNYYYSGHDPVDLPIYRITVSDAEHIRYYLSPTSGDVVGKVDTGQRHYRWFFEALHRWDIGASLRRRPWWDFIILPLVLGVTVVCFTGVYMEYRRVAPKHRGAAQQLTE